MRSSSHHWMFFFFFFFSTCNCRSLAVRAKRVLPSLELGKNKAYVLLVRAAPHWEAPAPPGEPQLLLLIIASFALCSNTDPNQSLEMKRMSRAALAAAFDT